MAQDNLVNEIEIVSETKMSNFTIIENAILRDGIYLTMGAKFLYMNLLSYAFNRSKTVFPSLSLLMQQMNVSKQSLLNYIKELEKFDMLEVQRHKKENGMNRVNVYVLKDIPREIEQSAHLCSSLSNKDIVKQMKTDFKETKQVTKKEKNEVNEQLKQQQEEQNLETITYILTQNPKFKEIIPMLKEYDLLKELYLIVKNKKQNIFNNKATYVKIFGSFVLNFKRIPTEDEMIYLSKLSYQPKVIMESMIGIQNIFSQEFTDALKLQEKLYEEKRMEKANEQVVLKNNKRPSISNKPLMSNFDASSLLQE